MTLKRIAIGLCAIMAIAGCARDNVTNPFDDALPGTLPAPPVGYDSADDVRKAVDDGALNRVPTLESAPRGVTHTPDVPYVTRGDTTLVMDIYQPAELDAPRPGLIFIHGGGWRGGSRDFYAAWAAHFAAKGYICATIQYRFSDKAPYPAAVLDTLDAVQWVHDRAGDLGIDAEAIGLVGQSAGGHLALMAAYAPGFGIEDGLRPTPIPRVKAVVAFYPPTDFTVRGIRGIDPVKMFLDARYMANPDRYEEASPMTYVTADDPPTLLVHGTVDDVVPVEQSDALAARLDALDVPYWYDRMEGWHHAMDLYDKAHDHCLAVLERFLEAQLEDTN